MPEKIPQDVLDFFGKNLYRFPFEAFRNSSTYSMGDVTFCITRNRDSGREITSGVFPADDMRGLFIYYFCLMYGLRGMPTFVPELSFPMDEMVEITIFGPVSPLQDQYLGRVERAEDLGAHLPHIALWRMNGAKST